ncbi:MAG: 1-acyl-sn-glycerol-3-phosphate acyltransferase [Bacteroidales bacterium]
MKTIAFYLLKCFGWHVTDFSPCEKKYVLIVAPHTSAWDFVIGRTAFSIKEMPAKFIIKREFFVFPFGIILKSLGGLPINREQAGNVVEFASCLLKEKEKMALVLTPEGTRKYNAKWKKGFYYIAKRANVPVYAGFLDYKKKCCGIFPNPILLTDDYSADIKKIENIYKGITAKYPENFNLSSL